MHPIILQIQEILRGSYPEWVWHRNPAMDLDHVPVFTFHTVKPESFELQLQFLYENGYQTLTSELYYEHMTKDKIPHEPSVMLTFDDGRKSVWNVAFPLLKKYGMKATVFLSPAIMVEFDQVSPNLDDVWQDKADIKSIENCDYGEIPVLNWREIQVMHEHGAIDFQCHSFSHQRIPVSSRILGYVTPELMDSHYFRFKIPFYPGIIPKKSNPFNYLGAPVYESAPCLSGRRMFLEPMTLRDRCVDHVKANGGADYFKQPDWQQGLNAITKDYWQETSNFEYESEADQIKRICQELNQAKKTIESYLPGHLVRHLAYPWGAGSDVAIKCSKDMGFLSNYWSTLPHRSSNRIGEDPFYLVRFKHDFIWRLPGKGRRTLSDVFLYKFKRRISGQIDY